MYTFSIIPGTMNLMDFILMIRLFSMTLLINKEDFSRWAWPSLMSPLKLGLEVRSSRKFETQSKREYFTLEELCLRKVATCQGVQAAFRVLSMASGWQPAGKQGPQSYNCKGPYLTQTCELGIGTWAVAGVSILAHTLTLAFWYLEYWNVCNLLLRHLTCH